MVSKLRAQRIGDRIQEELSQMLLLEIADPRLNGISVTDVRVDRELAFANIYVSAIEGSDRADEILAGLNHARGYLRYELSHRIDLRTFPQLKFHWDPTFERAERIDQIIKELNINEEDSAEMSDSDEE
jgi:ribosome-binding factor A